MVVIFAVAALCAYAGAMWYGAWGESFAGIGTATLIGQPEILNQREAVLDALQKSSTGPAVPLDAREEALAELEASSQHNPVAMPDDSARIQALEQLAASNRH